MGSRARAGHLRDAVASVPKDSEPFAPSRTAGRFPDPWSRSTDTAGPPAAASTGVLRNTARGTRSLLRSQTTTHSSTASDQRFPRGSQGTEL